MDTKKHIGSGAGILSLIILSVAAQAETVGTVSDGGVDAELHVSMGLLNGRSGEYVYLALPGYKISQLDWDVSNVRMMGIGGSLRVNDRLRFNADHWRSVDEGDGTMDDYDWLYVGLDWSHWSRSEDTRVLDLSNTDVNAEVTLFEFPQNDTAISALLGYKQEGIEWQAVGGYGIYSVGGYRDTSVVFPNVPVITYEQRFDSPYIGLGLRSTGGRADLPIVLSAGIRYSPWVQGNAVDIHHLRALKFEDEGDGGKWMAYDVKIDFHVAQNLAVNLAYSSQTYDEIKGSTTVTDLATGAVFLYPGDAAGMDHSSSMISLGLSYAF